VVGEVERRGFGDAILVHPPHHHVSGGVEAVFVDGHFDRIEWVHERDADGLLEVHLVPAAGVARLYSVREPGAEAP